MGRYARYDSLVQFLAIEPEYQSLLLEFEACCSPMALGRVFGKFPHRGRLEMMWQYPRIGILFRFELETRKATIVETRGGCNRGC